MRAHKSPDEPVPVIGHDGRSPVPLVDDLLTREEREQYLTLVGQGVGLDLAARAIGRTGTGMRRLVRRDEVFREEFQVLLKDGQQHYRDRLEAQARLRALNADNPSDRMLEVELATRVPGYEHLRRDRVKVDARLEHAIVLDPGALDRLSREQLLVLRSLMLELGGEVIDGTAREVGEGDGQ